MLKKTISILLLIIALFSCTETAVPVEITLVFTKQIDSKGYPNYISDIVMPFKGVECDNDIILKPINVSRIDINNKIVKTNAWYFENFGENTVEFSTNWLKPYFKDSVPPGILLLKNKKISQTKIADFIAKKNKKNNIFIFSEDSDLENYNGVPILNTPKEINQAISKVTCKADSKKIMVLINPFQKSPSPPDSIKPPPSPCKVNTISSAFDLKNDLLDVINTSSSSSVRKELAAKVWDKYFTKNAYVAQYMHRNDKNPDIWNPGEGKLYFVNRIAVLESITDINIFKVETSSKDGKISGIKVVECHNSSESL